MKKTILSISLLMTLAMPAAAQTDGQTDKTTPPTEYVGQQTVKGKWRKVVQQADALKGIEERTVYMYDVEEVGSLVVWDWNNFQFRLIGEHMFSVRHEGSSEGLTALVGIYDDDGNMTDDFRIWLDYERSSGYKFVRTRNRGTMSNPVGQKGKVRRMFNALQSGKGYVRIVAPRYDRTDFDIRVDALKE